MGWVDKYITKIEDQGRTIIACISRRLFNMHTLKGKPRNISLWLVDYSIEDVSNHITYGYENKSPCSYIDWVDRDTLGMNTMGGKEFNFLNEFFVLTSGKPQIYILQPLGTTHQPAHEVHSDLHVLEEI